MAIEADGLPAQPPKALRFKHRIRLVAAVRELWRQREIVRTLAEREIRARYKQTTLSWGWALISPLALMAVFVIFVNPVADVDTNGAPYSLFTYLGLLPWTFFSASLNLSSNTMINNKALINKIYCPREMFPVSAVVVAGIDALMASTALVVLFLVTGTAPAVTSLWVPLILVVQLAFVIGVSLVAAVTVVYVRDLRNAVPLLLQLGLFATPVAYSLEAIPQQWVGIYSFLNPLAPVIDSYRRTVLDGQAPQWDLLGYGALGAAILLFGGYWYFKHLETGIADLA